MFGSQPPLPTFNYAFKNKIKIGEGFSPKESGGTLTQNSYKPSHDL